MEEHEPRLAWGTCRAPGSPYRHGFASGEVVDVLVAGIPLRRLSVRYMRACRPPRAPGVAEGTGGGDLPLHCPHWVAKVRQWAAGDVRAPPKAERDPEVGSSGRPLLEIHKAPGTEWRVCRNETWGAPGQRGRPGAQVRGYRVWGIAAKVDPIGHKRGPVERVLGVLCGQPKMVGERLPAL